MMHVLWTTVPEGGLPIAVQGPVPQSPIGLIPD